ncbi:hypothetical protein GE061_003902 [Apolygus lucorum]|uniref:Essential protein Yae1 N-terminal domain-containing protein n=1 Tax=Apolygus lucorum TaxID=248454 RepID=A0A6A4J2C9_APOLU|nr:hypothetical protein GE061_003902 [Apolygus lucorum]
MQELSDVPDINDVFDSLVNAEEEVVDSGYQEGEEKGKREGEVEGYHLGYHRGAEVGSEIGYYLGFSASYLTGEGELNPKITAALRKLQILAQSIPETNDPNVDIIQVLEECRGCYKKVCVHLKVSPRLPNPVSE